MAKGMTLKEVKNKRTELEAEILKLVKAFQEETGVKVSYIDMRWQYQGNDVRSVPEGPEKRDLKDVGVSLDFDAIED